MRWLEIVRQVIEDGGPSTCQFAITNVCNAACDFCSFSRDKLPKKSGRSVGLEEGIQALDILHRQGIRFMVFTGGEPMVNRHLNAFLAHASRLGMTSMMVTNGSVLSPERIAEMARCGLRSVIISIDSPEVETHEKNRGLDGVIARIRDNMEAFRRHKIGTTASVTLSRLIKDTRELPGFLKELGFQSVTFSFPLTALPSSYLGAADSSLVDFTKEEMHQLVDSVKALKKEFHVLNPSASLDDMHSHLDGAPERFECLGGWKQFYLDWNLMLWRCNSWSRPMCHITEFDGSQKVRDGCQECMVDCFRDASVLQHVAISVSDSVDALKKGEVSRAARQFFNSNTLISAQAVLENSFWLHTV